MCGRFVSAQLPQQLAEAFGAVLDDRLIAEGALPPSYNVAPTNDVYGIVAGDGAPVLGVFHWGFVPVWADDVRIGSRMINARAETLAVKPAFSSSFRTRRLIVPMDGFYEWRTVPGRRIKQPVYLSRVDGRPLAVAGLWTAWRDRAAGDDAPWLRSCAIITTEANAAVRSVHDRMPAILEPEAWDEWLDPDERDPLALGRLLGPAAVGVLSMRDVSTAVNIVANDGPELVAPLVPTADR